MWQFPLIFLLALVLPRAQALHFYLTGHEQKCFVEELSKDLHVQGISYRIVVMRERVLRQQP